LYEQQKHHRLTTLERKVFNINVWALAPWNMEELEHHTGGSTRHTIRVGRKVTCVK
jgi:hypothetical protein